MHVRRTLKAEISDIFIVSFRCTKLDINTKWFKNLAFLLRPSLHIMLKSFYIVYYLIWTETAPLTLSRGKSLTEVFTSDAHPDTTLAFIQADLAGNRRCPSLKVATIIFFTGIWCWPQTQWIQCGDSAPSVGSSCRAFAWEKARCSSRQSSQNHHW